MNRLLFSKELILFSYILLAWWSSHNWCLATATKSKKKQNQKSNLSINSTINILIKLILLLFGGGRIKSDSNVRIFEHSNTHHPQMRWSFFCLMFSTSSDKSAKHIFWATSKIKLSGEQRIIQIDESYFSSKPKYHRGRSPNPIWVLQHSTSIGLYGNRGQTRRKDIIENY